MIKQIAKLAVAGFGFLMMTGCATNSPVVGGLYTNVTHSGIASGGIVDTDTKSVKTGIATCTSILGMVALGDCSQDAAKKNGGIDKIHSVSHVTTTIYVFFSKYDTIVTGE